MTTLSELAVKHPYYAADCNFYSNEPIQRFDTMTDYLNEWEDMDEDYGPVFRWDVLERYDDDDEPLCLYKAQVIHILQHKGIYFVCGIKSVKEDEVERFVKFMQVKRDYMNAMWAPL